MKPYEGDRDYIFISYSHKNRAKVEAIITAIAAQGYNIWYDEGIHAGSNWIETIVRKLRDSSIVIAFISKDYMSSKYCNNEIVFSYNRDKRIIPIYIEDIRLSDEFEFMFSTIQSIPEYKIPDKRVFMEKLLNTDFFVEMKRGETAAAPAVKSAEETTAENSAGFSARKGGVTYYNTAYYKQLPEERRRLIFVTAAQAFVLSKKAEEMNVTYSALYDKNEDKATLTFDKYKDQAFLSEVVFPFLKSKNTGDAQQNIPTQKNVQPSVQPHSQTKPTAAVRQSAAEGNTTSAGAASSKTAPAEKPKLSYFNTDYYRQISPANRQIIEMTCKKAFEISKKAQSKGVSYSAVYDKENNIAKLTFDKSKDAGFISEIMSVVNEN